MKEYLIGLPWTLYAVIAVLALYGLFDLGRRCWTTLKVFWLLSRGLKQSPEERNKRILLHQTEADQNAQTTLDEKVQKIWLSFQPVDWLNLDSIWRNCNELIEAIASAYYPSSKQPIFEVTVLELLRLNERVSNKISTLLSTVNMMNEVSVSTILDAKNIFDRAKKVTDHKGVKSGGWFASRAWQAMNFFNPQYWIGRVLYRGASEMVGRKLLTSLYRIVGEEAIRVYRSSSAVRVDPQALEREMQAGISGAEEQDDQSESAEADQRSNQSESKTPPPFEPEIIDEPDDTMDEKTEMNEEEEPPKSKRREKMYSAIGKTFSAFLEGTLTLWEKAVNVDKVLHSFRKQGMEINRLVDIQNIPIEQIDRIANRYITKGEWLSAAEGAATGVGGVLLLAADLPSLLALQLRTIQQIGYCYGFDMAKPEEKLFTAKLLAEAYQHPARKDRQTLVKEMRSVAGILSGKTPLGKMQQRLFVQGFTKIAEKIGLRMGSRKAAQLLPFVGAAVGGYVNKKITRDIAEIAQQVYRDRLLQSKEKPRLITENSGK